MISNSNTNERPRETPGAPTPLVETEMHFEASRRCERLAIDSRDLPDWAKTLLRVGYKAAAPAIKNDREVVFVGVPTRAFAATLISLGIVIQRATSSTVDTAEEIYSRVSNFSVGTRLHLERGKKTLKGVYCGLSKVGGERWLVIEVRGGERHYISPRECTRVNKIAESGAANQAPARISSRIEFLRHAFGYQTTRTLLGFDDSRVVMVGRVGETLDDMQAQVTLATRSRNLSGAIADVCRPRPKVDKTKPARMKIVAPWTQQQLSEDVECAIFEGWTAYAQQRHCFPSANWVVIADLSDPDYRTLEGAVSELWSTRGLGERTAAVGTSPYPAITSFRIPHGAY